MWVWIVNSATMPPAVWNDGSNFRNGQWQHSWLSPFTSPAGAQPLSLISLNPIAAPLTSHTRHSLALIFDLSSWTHFGARVLYSNGVAFRPRQPLCICWGSATQASSQSVALWPYDGLSHSLPVTGYTESQKSTVVPGRLYLDWTVMFGLTVKTDRVNSGDASHEISLEKDRTEICWVAERNENFR